MLTPDATNLLRSNGAESPCDVASKYAVLKAGVADSRSALTIIDGIPFLKSTAFNTIPEGGNAKLDDLNIEAEHLYLFGGVNSVDKPHYNWGGADDLKNQFVGNKAGSLRFRYRSGATDDVPLLFGYTIWWRESYNVSPEPFRSDPGKRAILDRALCVANGIRGEKAPYYLRIDLRHEPVLEIELTDDPAHVGHPVIDGITLGNVSGAHPLDCARFLGVDGDPVLSAWLSAHSVASANPLPRDRQAALRDLERAIYTYPDDLHAHARIETDCAELRRAFPGPKVKFTGPPEAAILANVFLENSTGLLDRVDDSTGMVHESAAKAPNYMGWVGYLPDAGSYFEDSYTRTHFIVLLSNTGFLEKADKAIEWFDRWMMFFPNSYPTLQLGGKPVPGHATVIANKPLIYFDVFHRENPKGWCTKFKTHDYGNPETDGHGILMTSRWRAWMKAGRTKEWVDSRWDAIHEAAEWIPWCLDHPELSFSEHGVLYSESEGGLCMESLYCNVPCYFGLLAYADMAETVGKEDVADRWRAQAERLLGAMNAYFPSVVDPWGEVWNPDKTGGWGPPTAMAPILEGMELYGYDAIHRLPVGWAERTRRTYAMASSKLKPRFCDSSAMGYGQGFLTQSALLLDRMEDATQMTEWIARLCFVPRQPHPYRVPESAVMKSDGSMWARGGDLGNGFQMGDTLLACHILLGMDDYDPGVLKLMPRLPLGWTGASVQDWPVRVTSSGKSEMAMLSTELVRDRDSREFDLKISTDKPIDNVQVRLGPFPMTAKQITAKNNHRNSNVTLFESGDSKWAWVSIGALRDSCLIQSQVK